ncbi:MAG TPA: hypothetical protein VM535_02060 [Candidatus Saccharimonadales bacterium]|nr:hypothetical protein [Candidatus Saccharimonadales bacterium]
MFGHDNDHHDDHNDNDQPANDAVKPDSDWQHPGTPLDDNASDDNNAQATPDTPPSDQPAPEGAAPAEEPKLSLPDTPAPSDSHHAADDLIDLKQQALTKLSPLVGHLDQTPDEKFKTLMMMIQASDDQSMVKEAYETALKIDDEKERAQALLDIVNEINYFTQNPSK